MVWLKTTSIERLLKYTSFIITGACYYNINHTMRDFYLINHLTLTNKNIMTCWKLIFGLKFFLFQMQAYSLICHTSKLYITFNCTQRSNKFRVCGSNLMGFTVDQIQYFPFTKEDNFIKIVVYFLFSHTTTFIHKL